MVLREREKKNRCSITHCCRRKCDQRRRPVAHCAVPVTSALFTFHHCLFSEEGSLKYLGSFFASDIPFAARFDLLFSIFAGCCNTQRNKVMRMIASVQYLHQCN